eukprot:8957952-Prorocentrum_lima.AAC.1
MHITETILRNSAFTLNATKTNFTTSGPQHPQWTKQYCPQFSILGTTHEAIVQAEDNGTFGPDAQTGTPLDPTIPDDTLLQAQCHFYTKLLYLHHNHELPMQHTMTLLRNFHNTIPIFQARSRLLNDPTAWAWDSNTIATIENILRYRLDDTQKAQLMLP